MDIEHLSNDLEQMQFENNRIYDEYGAQKHKADQNQSEYRSEMNLILSFDGAKPKFTEGKNQCGDHSGGSGSKPSDVTAILETPPPKVPQAMDLLPNTLPYVKKVDYKPHTASPSNSKSSLSDTVAVNDADHTPPKDRIDGTVATIPKPPPLPIAKDKLTVTSNSSGGQQATATVRRHFFRHNSSGISIVVDKDNVNERSSSSPEFSANTLQVPKIDAPDPQTDKSNDVDKVCVKIVQIQCTEHNRLIVWLLLQEIPTKNTSNETKHHTATNAKRKDSKRVSIYENDAQNNSGADKSAKDPSDAEEEEEKEVYIPSLTARRQTLSRKMSQEAFNHLMLPGTKSILYTPSPTPSRRNRSRSVSSRRHSSDGLILPPQMLDSHQHHHHRHHASPSSHHHRDRDRDSYMETGTSVSERCSNSLASSRESSTSLSQRSSSQQKSARKISASSHSQSNGKIPWCACWGNGCI